MSANRFSYDTRTSEVWQQLKKLVTSTSSHSLSQMQITSSHPLSQMQIIQSRPLSQMQIISSHPLSKCKLLKVIRCPKCTIYQVTHWPKMQSTFFHFACIVRGIENDIDFLVMNEDDLVLLFVRTYTRSYVCDLYLCIYVICKNK